MTYLRTSPKSPQARPVFFFSYESYVAPRVTVSAPFCRLGRFRSPPCRQASVCLCVSLRAFIESRAGALLSPAQTSSHAATKFLARPIRKKNKTVSICGHRYRYLGTPAAPSGRAACMYNMVQSLLARPLVALQLAQLNAIQTWTPPSFNSHCA
jgi:hypothetical protein